MVRGMTEERNTILNMIGRAFSSAEGDRLAEEDKVVSAARERAARRGEDPDRAAEDARIDLSAKRAIRAKSTGKPSDPPTPSMPTSRRPRGVGPRRRGPGQTAIYPGDVNNWTWTAKEEPAVVKLLRLMGVATGKIPERVEAFSDAVREVMGKAKRNKRVRPSNPDQQYLWDDEPEQESVQEPERDEDEIILATPALPLSAFGVPHEIEMALKSIHSGDGFSVVSLPVQQLVNQETLKGDKDNRPFADSIVLALVRYDVKRVLVSKDRNGMLCAMAIKAKEPAIAELVKNVARENGGWLVSRALGHPEWQFLSSE